MILRRLLWLGYAIASVIVVFEVISLIVNLSINHAVDVVPLFLAFVLLIILTYLIKKDKEAIIQGRVLVEWELGLYESFLKSFKIHRREIVHFCEVGVSVILLGSVIAALTEGSVSYFFGYFVFIMIVVLLGLTIAFASPLSQKWVLTDKGVYVRTGTELYHTLWRDVSRYSFVDKDFIIDFDEIRGHSMSSVGHILAKEGNYKRIKLFSRKFLPRQSIRVVKSRRV